MMVQKGTYLTYLDNLNQQLCIAMRVCCKLITSMPHNLHLYIHLPRLPIKHHIGIIVLQLSTAKQFGTKIYLCSV